MAYIKTKEEIELMRQSGQILAGVIEKVGQNAREGVSLIQLDRLANRLIKEAGATPAFLGYQPEGAEKPYPATICASLNEVVVHGVPTGRILKSGDILKLDFGLFYKGFCSDSAITVAIGEISEEAAHLIETTKKALYAGIREARIGNRLGDIGFAIQSVVERNSFKVVRGLTGHGIGKALHEEPVVYNSGQTGKGLILKSGMVLAIEPMTATGNDRIVQRKDESYATADSSLSAHFEHTVAVTESGPQILTVV